MDELDSFKRLALALGIGLLIGFERGWHQRDEPDSGRAAGLRTFSLMGLLGGVCGWLSVTVGALAILGGFIAFAALVIATYVAETKNRESVGATTEVAALLAFGLGILAGRGDLAGGVITAAVLDLKQRTETFLQRTRKVEVSGAIKLLLLSAVVLPILPNQGYGPGEVLNPYQLWWVIVLIAAVSFAGYLAIRLAGPSTGPFLMGLIGGLA